MALTQTDTDWVAMPVDPALKRNPVAMEILALGLSPRDAFGRTLAPFG
jgi:hypothetical protein